MKKINPLNIFIIAATLLVCFASINAQNGKNFDDSADDSPNTERRLVRLLGLNQEQIQQIRQIRREQVPLLRDAQRRQREAKRSLDQAIYADVFDESAIELYLKQFQTAQAEVARIRLTNELAVRRVLTPEQLEKFRTIRNQFIDRLQRPERRQNRQRGQQPLRQKRNQKPPPPKP